MTLSDARLRHLKPKTKTYKVSDFDGLYVAVTPNGSKLRRFKYRVDGKEKLLSIGAYPAISFLQARQARGAARASLAAGLDPSEQKQEKRRSRGEILGHTCAKMGRSLWRSNARKENRLRPWRNPNTT